MLCQGYLNSTVDSLTTSDLCPFYAQPHIIIALVVSAMALLLVAALGRLILLIFMLFLENYEIVRSFENFISIQ